MQRILALTALAFALASVGCAAGTSDRATKTAAPSPLKDPSVLVAQGDAYAGAGDFTRAQQYFAAAIASGAKSRVVLPRLLRACVAAGDLRLASEYAENELERDPDNARLRFLTGALHARVGDRVAARRHLVEAARSLGDDADVQFSVATFFRDDLADRVGADPYFREYLRLAPRGDHAAEARGSLMERMQ